MQNDLNVKDFLEEKVALYNNQSFISKDPICIPHQFDKKQDIEIAGLFAATLAWGQRKTIISKCELLISLMDHAPYEFILNHQEDDLKPFLEFKHRTFNATDTLFFIEFLKQHYAKHDSLEDAFMNENESSMKMNLTHFHDYMFSHDFAPERTRKHVATPLRKSACKRLNMFLRWMVRQDSKGGRFWDMEKNQPSESHLSARCSCRSYCTKIGPAY